MSVVPQGKSVQALYRDFREGNLLVNRTYQRKLVWSSDEKKSLVDSILQGYPIPLILLAERPMYTATVNTKSLMVSNA